MDRNGFLIVCVLLIAVTGCARATPPPTIPAPTTAPAAIPTTPPDTIVYYPTQAWKTSTPEQQGVDSAALAKLFDEIQTKQYNIHSIIIGDKRVDTTVGLDNVYRVTRIEARGDVALRGFWQNDKTFVIQQQFLNEADRLEYAFTFDKAVVDLRVTGFIESTVEQVRGKVQN